MLFDNEMNKELQSFSRNMASQFFIGGLGFLTLYRADTKTDLVAYQFFSLYIVGLLLLLWSIYLAISNVCILNHDFKNYLWRKAKKHGLKHLMESSLEVNTLNTMVQKFKVLKTTDRLKINLEGAFIILIWFLYACIYFIGISFTFFQQSRLFII
jgi:hypothetical protein